MKITNQLVIAYLNCKYKAHLLTTDIASEPSNYEAFLQSQAEDYTGRAISTLVASENSCPVARSKPILVEELREGAAIVLDVNIENELLAFNIDCIKRAHGESSLGLFHYEPVLFFDLDEPIGESSKILLSVSGLALEQMQHFRPSHGTVVRGVAYKSQRIDLSKTYAKAEKIVNELNDLLIGVTRPPLWLNEHCRVCRYQSHCKTEAQRTDDLSQLRRMSEHEIHSFNSKGIMTVKQLSYTFRFRRRAKRVKVRGRPHSFSLQALAIGEQSVFVVSRPEVRNAPTLILMAYLGTTTMPNTQ